MKSIQYPITFDDNDLLYGDIINNKYHFLWNKIIKTVDYDPQTKNENFNTYYCYVKKEHSIYI